MFKLTIDIPNISYSSLTDTELCDLFKEYVEKKKLLTEQSSKAYDDIDGATKDDLIPFALIAIFETIAKEKIHVQLTIDQLYNELEKRGLGE